MGESVPVFVVLSGEALDMVLARSDGAFLGAFASVRKHVSLEVLKDASALRQRTHALLHGLIIQLEAASAATASACARAM